MKMNNLAKCPNKLIKTALLRFFCIEEIKHIIKRKLCIVFLGGTFDYSGSDRTNGLSDGF